MIGTKSEELTVKAAATALDLCEEQVRRLIRSGELPAKKERGQYYVDREIVSLRICKPAFECLKRVDPVLFSRLKEAISDHYG